MLKELPNHMKYAFLEPEGANPVIILATLNENEEQRCLEFSGIIRKQLPCQLKTLKVSVLLFAGIKSC